MSKQKRKLKKNQVQVDGNVYTWGTPTYNQMYEDKFEGGDVVWDNLLGEWVSVPKGMNDAWDELYKNQRISKAQDAVRKGTASFARPILDAGLEMSGAAGAYRFAQDPLKNLQGTGNVLSYTNLPGLIGHGIDYMQGNPFFNVTSEDLEGLANTVDVVGLAAPLVAQGLKVAPRLLSSTSKAISKVPKVNLANINKTEFVTPTIDDLLQHIEYSNIDEKNRKIIQEGNKYFRELRKPESQKRLKEFGKEYGIDLEDAYKKAEDRWDYNTNIGEHSRFKVKKTDDSWYGLSTTDLDYNDEMKILDLEMKFGKDSEQVKNYYKKLAQDKSVNYISDVVPLEKYPKTIWHELSHDINKSIIDNSPKLQEDIKNIFIQKGTADLNKVKEAREYVAQDFYTKKDDVLKDLDNPERLQEIGENEFDYVTRPTETWAFLSTNLRQDLKNTGLINDYNDLLTNEILEQASKNKNTTWSRFEPYIADKDKFINLFNKMTLGVVPGAIATGAIGSQLMSQEESAPEQKAYGGKITNMKKKNKNQLPQMFWGGKLAPQLFDLAANTLINGTTYAVTDMIKAIREPEQEMRPTKMNTGFTMANGGMIKRADGSYSKRGLWDNIRANKGSGKKPTKQMLEQEKKIRAQMDNGGIVNPTLPFQQRLNQYLKQPGFNPNIMGMSTGRNNVGLGLRGGPLRQMTSLTNDRRLAPFDNFTFNNNYTDPKFNLNTKLNYKDRFGFKGGVDYTSAIGENNPDTKFNVGFDKYGITGDYNYNLNKENPNFNYGVGYKGFGFDTDFRATKEKDKLYKFDAKLGYDKGDTSGNFEFTGNRDDYNLGGSFRKGGIGANFKYANKKNDFKSNAPGLKNFKADAPDNNSNFNVGLLDYDKDGITAKYAISKDNQNPLIHNANVGYNRKGLDAKLSFMGNKLDPNYNFNLNFVPEKGGFTTNANLDFKNNNIDATTGLGYKGKKFNAGVNYKSRINTEEETARQSVNARAAYKGKNFNAGVEYDRQFATENKPATNKVGLNLGYNRDGFNVNTGVNYKTLSEAQKERDESPLDFTAGITYNPNYKQPKQKTTPWKLPKELMKKNEVIRMIDENQPTKGQKLINALKESLAPSEYYAQSLNLGKRAFGGMITPDMYMQQLMYGSYAMGGPIEPINIKQEKKRMKRQIKSILSGKPMSTGITMTKLNPDEEDTYQQWVKSLTPNLRDSAEDKNYDMRGAWKAGLEPELFYYDEQGNFQTAHPIDVNQQGSIYEPHLGSRDPNTGKILKGPHHPTYMHAIEGDIKAGYYPYVDFKTGDIYTKKYAQGGQVPQNIPVEVEGGEAYELPNGEMGEFEGPSHENGGIPVALPEQTKVYSKQLKVNGKTMADRKTKREANVAKLEKILSKNPSDKFVREALKRQQETAALEEQQDMAMQEQANQQQQMQEQAQQGMMQEQAMAGLMQDPAMMQQMGMMMYGGKLGNGTPPYGLLNYVSPTLSNAVNRQIYENQIPTETVDGKQFKVMEDIEYFDGKPFTVVYDQFNKPKTETTKPNVTDTNPPFLTEDQLNQLTNFQVSPLDLREKKGGVNVTKQPAPGVNPYDVMSNILGQTFQNIALSKDPYINTKGGMIPNPLYNEVIGNKMLIEEEPKKPNKFMNWLNKAADETGDFFTGLFDGKGKPKKEKAKKEGTKSANELPFTPGDYMGMAGTLFGGLAPITTTMLNRMMTPKNQNFFREYGAEGLRAMQEAQALSGINRDKQLADIKLGEEASRQRGRNSARGVNTLRAMDIAADMGANQAQNQAYNAYAQQMMQLLSQKGQMENQQDQMVMQGEYQRDLADRQDVDQFYTNLAENFASQSELMQKQGRDMNQAQYNKMILEMSPMFSKYGIGVSIGKNGKIEYTWRGEKVDETTARLKMQEELKKEAEQKKASTTTETVIPVNSNVLPAINPLGLGHTPYFNPIFTDINIPTITDKSLTKAATKRRK